MIRLRNTDEWVGLLVVLACIVFAAAVLHAGLLRDWFSPVSTLRIVLPDSGAAGLAVGAEVEVLGTKAGTVRRIVLDPNAQMYAEAEIDSQARGFIRRDSTAAIRRRFSIAGPGYVTISRGHGAELDWTYAVINAATDRAPTDALGALVEEAQTKVFPILNDVGRASRALADLLEHTQRGEGSLGRLVMDDTLAREVEAAAAGVPPLIKGIGEILAQGQAAVGDVRGIIQAAGTGESGLPALLRRADQTLASLQSAARDLAKATPRVPQITRNVEGGTANLPALLTQTEVTAHQLELLLAQLRGVWLLGGSAPPSAATQRLPAGQVRP